MSNKDPNQEVLTEMYLAASASSCMSWTQDIDTELYKPHPMGFSDRSKKPQERVRRKNVVRWICIVSRKVKGMRQKRKLICGSNERNNKAMSSERLWI